MTIDSREVRAFAVELAGEADRIAPEVARSVFRGASQIKAAMQADMSASTSFKGVARSIDFDTMLERDAYAAEIGPRHGPGDAGNLANIAYFGGSRGGGTVRDPQQALDDEAPKFERALEAIMKDVL